MILRNYLIQHTAFYKVYGRIETEGEGGKAFSYTFHLKNQVHKIKQVKSYVGYTSNRNLSLIKPENEFNNTKADS